MANSFGLLVILMYTTSMLLLTFLSCEFEETSLFHLSGRKLLMLPKTDQSDDEPPPMKKICSYSITTVTGNKLGAGTDATVSVKFSNRDRDSVTIADLDNGNNNFERGHVDNFLVLGACVSEICAVTLSTDDSGWAAAWYIDRLSVTVTDDPSNDYGVQEKSFSLKQWLPKNDAAASLYTTLDDCKS